MAIHAAAGEMPKQNPRNKMRPARKPLGVGIEKQNRERHRGKFQRQRIQLPGRNHQNRDATSVKIQAKETESAPVASARFFVRGFSLS